MKLKITLNKSKLNLSILFSIISKINTRGKRKIIGSQIKIEKVVKTIKENILKILFLGINR